MKLLECGCELSPGNRLVSICAMHAEHYSAVSEISKHPRAEGVDREFQKALVLAVAPDFTRRAINAIPTISSRDTAEAVLNHVNEIMRRLD